MDKNYFAVYKGIVEDNKDPEFRNRLKVRVREIYGMEGSGFRTEDLPWASPSSNIITYPPYDIGTIVYVVFDNGDPYYPIYTGYFVKPFPESQCYNCLHYFAAKRCKAFPNGIPELIFFNEFDHRDVYYDSEEVNDHDIVFTYKNSSSYDEIYGVSWKLNDSSSTGERTYYAKGLVANVGVDDQSVYNSFNELSPWCDRRRCNGYYNENHDFIVTAYEGEENYIDNNPEIMVYVETPLFYYFDGIKDGIEQKLISPNPIDGFLPSPACVKDDGTISNFSYSAAYESSVYNVHGTSYSGSFTDENAKQYSKFSIKIYINNIRFFCIMMIGLVITILLISVLFTEADKDMRAAIIFVIFFFMFGVIILSIILIKSVIFKRALPLQVTADNAFIYAQYVGYANNIFIAFHSVGDIRQKRHQLIYGG